MMCKCLQVRGKYGGDIEVGNVPLLLPLPCMGCIRTTVDDTGGLMDGPCDVDAS